MNANRTSYMMAAASILAASPMADMSENYTSGPLLLGNPAGRDKRPAKPSKKAARKRQHKARKITRCAGK